ncbi:MAG: type II toxin-antitoxin system RelE/ParE family toxin [Proteobacteria bacterium]|nr:type II toxin-antitoxin system RelE/ParE family toxin [Pseudomonadota bacterium]
MKLIITPDAEFDIVTAQQWYERERNGLGKQFRAQMGHSIKRILNNPHAYIEVYKQIRRVILNRFPMVLYYILHEENIIILACIHASRSQEYINSRLNLN